MNLKHTICLAALFISGCCPVLYTEHPGFSGRVIYSDTQLPAAGTDVNLKRIDYPDAGEPDSVVASVKTEPNGEFYIKAPKQLGIYIIPMDFFAVQYRLEIIHRNRLVKSTEYSHGALGYKNFYDLGEISFDPGQLSETAN